MTADTQNQQKNQNPAQGGDKQRSDFGKPGSSSDQNKPSSGFNPNKPRADEDEDERANDPYKKSA